MAAQIVFGTVVRVAYQKGRDQIVHIQIKYKQGEVGIVHFGDKNTSHSCLSTVLVHKTTSHIDVSVMN